MQNSRRSKKRSKFFWPEIGLLILGVLGFKPELLYNIFGVSNQSTYSNVRPANQPTPSHQHPLTSNPLLAWGAQAIQSAATQAANSLPATAQSLGQITPAQQQYYPQYSGPQYSGPQYSGPQHPPYQQPMNYAYYGHYPYQSAPVSPPYATQYNNSAVSSNGNLYIPTATAYYSAASAGNRVPPAEYQNTPASFPIQGRPTVPFPSTTAANQATTPNYGNIYGTNVRKEETEYSDPRLSLTQHTRTQPNPSPYTPTTYNYSQYGQPAYTSVGSAQNSAYANPSNQAGSTSQDQYYWGAIDPRANTNLRADSQRVGTQGSWVPNVPVWPQGAGRVVRY